MTLNIGFYGYGVVGQATGKGFESLGHNIVPYDINLDNPIELLQNTDIIFICVPTPVDDSGACDISIVEEAIINLINNNIKSPICIKSTVEPGTTKLLSEKYNININFVPEFLRERCAYEDFVENHDILAVGSTDDLSIDLIKQAHGHLPKNVEIMTSTEAEILKYYSNVYNAVKVIFANNFYEISQALNADYDKILNAYLKRDIKKNEYLSVNDNLRGYAGVCLPKDTKAISHLMKKLDINLDLIHATDSDNSKLKKTVFEGMRLS